VSVLRPPEVSPALRIAGIEVGYAGIVAALVLLGLLVVLGLLLRGRRHRGPSPASASRAAVAPPAAARAPAAVAEPASSRKVAPVARAPARPAPASAPARAPAPVPPVPRAGAASVFDDVGADTDLELERVLAAIHEDEGSGTATDVDLDPPPTEAAPDLGDTWDESEMARKTADPDALKEVDTLIAFEHYEQAKAILDGLLAVDPGNPEYLLRHYHVRTHGGLATSHDDEELLRAMMDGPLSDTMLRVREIGRTMMPGDPLFQQDGARSAARELLAGEAAGGPSPAGRGAEAGTDTEDADYPSTVVLSLEPMEESEARGSAKLRPQGG
jgi:hypothetical protein